MTVAPLIRDTPRLTQLQGSIAVLATGVVFSFGGLAYRSADAAGPWQYTTFRGLGALLAASTYLVVRRRHELRSIAAAVQPQHALLGLLIGSISCLFIVALELASVAFVMFLQTASPIAAAYISWLVLRERVSRHVVIATVATLAGTGVMVSGTFGDGVRPAGLVAVAIPFVFGLYTTLVRAAPSIETTVPVIFSGLTMLAAGTVITVVGGGFVITGGDALTAAFAGALLMGVPLVVFNEAQRVVPASESTLLLMSEVVLAPLWVWVFIAERPAWTTLVGGGIILAAIAWLTLVRVPRRGRVATSRG